MAHAAETPSRCRRPQLDDVRIPHSRFLGPADASARIEQLLRGGRPSLVTRMGNAEQEVSFCFHTQNARARSAQSWQIDRNAGVYWTPSARARTRRRTRASSRCARRFATGSHVLPAVSGNDNFVSLTLLMLIVKACRRRF